MILGRNIAKRGYYYNVLEESGITEYNTLFFKLYSPTLIASDITKTINLHIYVMNDFR